uniref:PCI domain-containing protein n=1 Tax=Panagrolaimus sp. PS1159 TaxID=55785 RepID=A0AC35FWI5_9BILA
MNDTARLQALNSIVSVKTVIKYDEMMSALSFDNEDALEGFIVSAIYNGHISGRLDPLHHRLEVTDFNDRTVDPSELPAMLETLESWSQYTERFLKHIDAAVEESDKNLSVRMTKEREIEKSVAQQKENGRTSENIGDMMSLDGPKETVKRSKRH